MMTYVGSFGHSVVKAAFYMSLIGLNAFPKQTSLGAQTSSGS